MSEESIYDLLSLDLYSDEAAVKKAFRDAAMASHPDRHPGDASAEDEFKALSAAYKSWEKNGKTPPVTFSALVKKFNQYAERCSNLEQEIESARHSYKGHVIKRFMSFFFGEAARVNALHELCDYTPAEAVRIYEKVLKLQRQLQTQTDVPSSRISRLSNDIDARLSYIDFNLERLKGNKPELLSPKIKPQ